MTAISAPHRPAPGPSPTWRCHYRPSKSARSTRPEIVDSWLESVECAAGQWVGPISEFLGLPAPSETLSIALVQGARMPMTRGREIFLPVDDEAGGLDTALASLAHELVHVLAGRSPSHLLNEGLAVHVDDCLRLAGPVWPFYNLGADRWARAFSDDGGWLSLSWLVAATPMPAGQAPATPNYTPAPPRAGLAPGTTDTLPVLTRFYLQAASYVRFRMTSVDRDQFWNDYRGGQPVPGEGSLADVESAWRRQLAGPLTNEERTLVSRSLDDHRRRYCDSPS